ncbi:metalloregulator ArsR/SmtB family transcription factor [Nesterenkonia sp.]|uniref:ArsR/SmtB family transcription factor n=1 Tax=Nesterenkonia sp. TaxID=704201 RepID=UPI00260A9483|nr:metalloregulator ArsR/SmtB family transcription factor [Nesterenkonia sp.]
MSAAEDLACCTSPPQPPRLESESAAELAARFKALGDPNRLMLLSLIAAGENGEACVCDLTEPLNLGQPTVSHHLKILMDAGFLTRQRRGTWSYYSLVPAALAGLCHQLCSDTDLLTESGAERTPRG